MLETFIHILVLSQGGDTTREIFTNFDENNHNYNFDEIIILINTYIHIYIYI